MTVVGPFDQSSRWPMSTSVRRHSAASRSRPSRLRSGRPGLRQPSGSRMVSPFTWPRLSHGVRLTPPPPARVGGEVLNLGRWTFPFPACPHRRRRGAFTFAVTVAGKLVVSAACPLREYARDSPSEALQAGAGHDPALEFPGLFHLAHGEPSEHVEGDRAELPGIAGEAFQPKIRLHAIHGHGWRPVGESEDHHVGPPAPFDGQGDPPAGECPRAVGRLFSAAHRVRPLVRVQDHAGSLTPSSASRMPSSASRMSETLSHACTSADQSSLTMRSELAAYQASSLTVIWWTWTAISAVGKPAPMDGPVVEPMASAGRWSLIPDIRFLPARKGSGPAAAPLPRRASADRRRRAPGAATRRPSTARRR